MSESANDTVFLTQAAYDKLAEELEELRNNREAISRKIAQAREEGDLSENAGYHAAREEQGQQEGRIAEITHILRTAEVSDGPASTDRVSAGALVTIMWDDDEEDVETFFLGSRENAALDPSLAEFEVYSPQSPLGAAVLDKQVGESATYATPSGAEITVTVQKIETR